MKLKFDKESDGSGFSVGRVAGARGIRYRTTFAKGGAVKPAVKKFAMGGMMGELPTVSAAQQQANSAEVARQEALQQQYMQQQRQQQARAAPAPAPRMRVPAPAGRARTQAMMAKGGAVKGKKK